MAIDLEAIVQAFVDNADYDSANSISMAKAFRTACRRLLIVPEEMYRQHERLRYAPRADVVNARLTEVNSWLGAKSIGATTEQYIEFKDYRD